MSTVLTFPRAPGRELPVPFGTTQISGGTAHVFSISDALAKRHGIGPWVILGKAPDELGLGVFRGLVDPETLDIQYVWSDDPDILAAARMEPAVAVLCMLDLVSGAAA